MAATTVNVSAWRQDFQVWPGAWLDHTYVGQGPGAGANPPANYYACWCQTFVETQYPAAPVVSGNIHYLRANCYRDSALGFPDTAGIGVYGINGVCHQSANCFLYSAGVLLNFSVIGYWASLLAYGPWGTNYPLWLAAVYGWCDWLNPSVVAETPEPADVAPSADVTQLLDLYASFHAQPQPPSTNDVIMGTAATVVQQQIPGFDPSTYQDLHAEFLSQKDAAIATGDTGKALADQLNNLSQQLQLAVADRVGPELYKKLNGVDVGQTAVLCDPRMTDAVGVSVPPFQHVSG